MKYLLLLLCQIAILFASGQKIKIEGVILDADMKPLAFASVAASDGNGRSASSDGRFSLIVKKDAVLRISCVGYCTFRYSATKSGKLQIQLINNAFSGRVMTQGVFFSNQEKIDGKLIHQELNDSLINTGKNDEELRYIFQRVEINPSLGGNIDSIFLADIRYDEVSDSKEIFLSFTISKNKKVENIKIIKGYSNDVDEQLIQNLSKVVYVFPSEQNGRRISTSCTLKFVLEPNSHAKRLKIRNVD